MTAKENPDELELIRLFLDRYLPREEIIHRLPVAMPIDPFWKKLADARRQLAIDLPLYTQNKEAFRFVLNQSIQKQCDEVAAMARRDQVFDGSDFDAMADEAVIDEAVYSSLIEGAFTTRKEAAKFIHAQTKPKNRAEQMVKNNYHALTYVLEHLDEPITEEIFINIGKIVTKNASETEVTGYRSASVYINDPNGVVYTPPEAKAVPEMMKQLVLFIHENDLHPILKACIAHFYFVYIHPFWDGNGRTARALSYMMLLQSGYDFFRYFSISDIVSKERGKYYRAIKNVEDSDGDMTYFIDFYSDMLARTVKRIENHLICHVYAGQMIRNLEASGKLNERQLKGTKWLLESQQAQITVEAWRKKHKVSVETARHDLNLLCEQGLLVRTMQGKKAVFRISYEN